MIISANYANAQNASFSVLESSFDFKRSAIVTELKCNSNCSTIIDKGFLLEITIPGTSIYTGAVSQFQSSDTTQSIELSGTVLRSGVEEILSHYPGGVVPVDVKLKISRDKGWFSGYDWSHGLPHYIAYSGSHSVKMWLDNHEFNIGVVQVVPPNFDLNQQQLCFLRDEKWGSPGWDPVGISTDCAKEWDWGSNAATISTQSIPLTSIIFSDKTYTTIQDLNGFHGQNMGPSDIYSFKSITKYWKDLLLKHSIHSGIETPLGKNPSFKLTLIPPVAKASTLTSSDHGEVKAFFREAVSQYNIDLSPYDFVVYIMYIPKTSMQGSFTRSFAAGNATYAAVNLHSDFIATNRSYLTLVHELGHMFFGLNDLYEGFGIQFPKGVPNPSVVTQDKACIMAKSFAYQLSSPSVASQYDTVNELPAVPFVLNKPKYYTADPKNFILCADDLLKITKGKDNPNCNITDFYAGKCGASCSSENYWTCQSSGITSTPVPTLTPVFTATNTATFTPTPSPVATWTRTATPTSTKTPTPTFTVIYTATATPARTNTPYPTLARRPYQNPSNPLDVNNDTLITVADRDIIVDLLNNHRDGPLAPPPAGAIVNIFADTSGDNFLAGDDLLLVVNYLAARMAETPKPTSNTGNKNLSNNNVPTPYVKTTATPKPSGKIMTPEQKKKQRERKAAKKKADRLKKRLEKKL